MEGKKISFGFLKTKKQDKPVTVEKKEYIECVEEKAIKVVGGEVIEETKPLVIPMKPNTLITTEKLKQIAEKVENFDEPVVKVEKEEDTIVPDNETLDQMAVRELVEEAKKIKKEVETDKLVVPINAKPVMDGQAEASLEDYESVPVQDFGLAMLRGMGWTPGKDQSKYKQPQLRPKGLGLGADKVVKEKKKNKTKDKEEELSIVKNSFVKITTGKYNGLYGKVVSLDEDNGRVMVDIIMRKETVSLSEFMMQAVTKAEFDKQSKVINSESYEEYKKKETLNSSKGYNSTRTEETRKEGTSSKKSNDIHEKEPTEKRENRRNYDEKYSNGNNKSKETERYRKESSSSEEERSRHRKKNKKKYSSNESLSSESDHKHKSLDRRRDSSSDSSDRKNRKKEKSHKSKSSKEKRDIDKKRKGKKKKRDRDRSPNYKKHRK